MAELGLDIVLVPLHVAPGAAARRTAAMLVAQLDLMLKFLKIKIK